MYSVRIVNPAGTHGYIDAVQWRPNDRRPVADLAILVWMMRSREVGTQP